MNDTIALLHPGDMGGAVGACFVQRGLRVSFAAAGRSTATLERARAAGLEDAGTLAACLAPAQIALAVCPPHAALDLAREVAACGFRGCYVDANAIAPATAREVGRIVESAGATFVDGGIIGPPPRGEGRTRLYLSGHQAAMVAALCEGTPLRAIVVDGPPGAASAVKACYSAWNKGTIAMLAAIRALARHEGVDQEILVEWSISHPELVKRSEAITTQAQKAWRWIGEMDELAQAFEAAGLPDGFVAAAGECYERLTSYKDATPPIPFDAILAKLGSHA